MQAVWWLSNLFMIYFYLILLCPLKKKILLVLSKAAKYYLQSGQDMTWTVCMDIMDCVDCMDGTEIVILFPEITQS